MTFDAIMASARRATWGWPYRVWPEDARQEIAMLLVELGEGNVRLTHVAAALERMARAMVASSRFGLSTQAVMKAPAAAAPAAPAAPSFEDKPIEPPMDELPF